MPRSTTTFPAFLASHPHYTPLLVTQHLLRAATENILLAIPGNRTTIRTRLHKGFLGVLVSRHRMFSWGLQLYASYQVPIPWGTYPSSVSSMNLLQHRLLLVCTSMELKSGLIGIIVNTLTIHVLYLSNSCSVCFFGLTCLNINYDAVVTTSSLVFRSDNALNTIEWPATQQQPTAQALISFFIFYSLAEYRPVPFVNSWTRDLKSFVLRQEIKGGEWETATRAYVRFLCPSKWCNLWDVWQAVLSNFPQGWW